MSPPRVEKALKRARKAEAAMLKAGVLLAAMHQRFKSEMPESLRASVQQSIEDYRAIVEAQQRREAMTKEQG